jgi:antitoxin (DNA-binding transcriptional repressor) of toxin-antitoxin stability system
MLTDTRDLVSITEASRTLPRLIQEAENGRSLVVLRNNTPAAAIVPVPVIEQLQSIEERESDLRLLSLAMARTLTDTGERYDLDEIIGELDLNSTGN